METLRESMQRHAEMCRNEGMRLWIESIGDGVVVQDERAFERSRRMYRVAQQLDAAAREDHAIQD